jgi:hypothetical protein
MVNNVKPETVFSILASVLKIQNDISLHSISRELPDFTSVTYPSVATLKPVKTPRPLSFIAILLLM